jgi:hypothetical protein
VEQPGDPHGAGRLADFGHRFVSERTAANDLTSVKTSTNITGGGDGARVVLTCDPMHGAPKTFNSWFNTGCVEAPIAGTVAHPDLYNSAGTAVVSAAVAAAPFSTGSGVFSPKVSYFLPGNGNFDTALFKNWSIENKESSNSGSRRITPSTTPSSTGRTIRRHSRTQINPAATLNCPARSGR